MLKMYVKTTILAKNARNFSIYNFKISILKVKNILLLFLFFRNFESNFLIKIILIKKSVILGWYRAVFDAHPATTKIRSNFFLSDCGFLFDYTFLLGQDTFSSEGNKRLQKKISIFELLKDFYKELKLNSHANHGKCSYFFKTHSISPFSFCPTSI